MMRPFEPRSPWALRLVTVQQRPPPNNRIAPEIGECDAAQAKFSVGLVSVTPADALDRGDSAGLHTQVIRSPARRSRRSALFFFHPTLSRLQQTGDHGQRSLTDSGFANSIRARPDPLCAEPTRGQAKIVAIGSSTTAGHGNIKPYPERLLSFLQDEYLKAKITMANKGIGGQEAPIEFQRFDTDVIAEKPDLVIWQVGTNAVWQSPDQDPPPPSSTKPPAPSAMDLSGCAPKRRPTSS